jgi:cbb3-type cytochrome oxidase subunit 1
MSMSRGYLLMGALYLVIGIVLGGYMSATSDHTLAPLHAHINLLGFVVMSIFGIVFRLIPAIGDSGLAKAQFWLHQAGALVLLAMLFLLLNGSITEAAMVPLAPIAELAILIAVLLFGWNLFQNAK